MYLLQNFEPKKQKRNGEIIWQKNVGTRGEVVFYANDSILDLNLGKDFLVHYPNPVRQQKVLFPPIQKQPQKRDQRNKTKNDTWTHPIIPNFIKLILIMGFTSL